MFFLKQANSLWMNITVTVLVFLLVVVLPAVDIAVCTRLQLNVPHRTGKGKHASLLLKVRGGLLLTALGAYLALNAYLVVFSRRPSTILRINTAFLSSFFNAFRIEPNVITSLWDLFTKGLSNVTVLHP